ncbi:MAG: response regulator transcription factor [Planctomycetota bacterium]
MADSDFPFRFTGALWSNLTSDPGTAVLITDGRGRVVWLDASALSLFFPADASSSGVVGKVWVGGTETGWLGEWLVLLRRIAQDGRARVMRCIWRGYQTFFWVHPVTGDEVGSGVDEGLGVDREPGRGPMDGEGFGEGQGSREVRFLVIARRITQDVVEGAGRMGGTPAGAGLAEGGLEMIESGYADLGPLSVLSSRELEVLALLGQGMSAKEIAGVLHRSPKTVENHRNAIGNKLGVGDRVLLAAMARRAGLTRADAGKKRIRAAG